MKEYKKISLNVFGEKITYNINESSYFKEALDLLAESQKIFIAKSPSDNEYELSGKDIKNLFFEELIFAKTDDGVYILTGYDDRNFNFDGEINMEFYIPTDEAFAKNFEKTGISCIVNEFREILPIRKKERLEELLRDKHIDPFKMKVEDAYKELTNDEKNYVENGSPHKPVDDLIQEYLDAKEF